ncbi:MAG: hypothetical protein MI741_14870, partial [Rhodospirillales bacterium]|nr:hypothetical protein [Rhodospirillales bacterium]
MDTMILRKLTKRIATHPELCFTVTDVGALESVLHTLTAFRSDYDPDAVRRFARRIFQAGMTPTRKMEHAGDLAAYLEKVGNLEIDDKEHAGDLAAYLEKADKKKTKDVPSRGFELDDDDDDVSDEDRELADYINEGLKTGDPITPAETRAYSKLINASHGNSTPGGESPPHDVSTPGGEN